MPKPAPTIAPVYVSFRSGSSRRVFRRRPGAAGVGALGAASLERAGMRGSILPEAYRTIARHAPLTM